MSFDVQMASPSLPDTDCSPASDTTESRSRSTQARLDAYFAVDTGTASQRTSSHSSTDSRAAPPSREQRQPGRRRRDDEDRQHFKRIAEETLALLPGLLVCAPQASTRSYVYTPATLPHLRAHHCPRFAPVRVAVVNEDCLDAAINLAACSRYLPVDDRKPVCVLNMANATRPGGGFRNGALAQEEAICLRSSLYFTLKRRYYPLHAHGGLFSPAVLVFRHGDRDRTRYDAREVSDMPIVSVVSVAALRDPQTVRVPVESPRNGTVDSQPHQDHVEAYARASDREDMMERMRVILRIAAYNRCRRLILGAFGCGAFHNPNREVAECWAKVLREREFHGGWWEALVFAVVSPHGTATTPQSDTNFQVFSNLLHGLRIS